MPEQSLEDAARAAERIRRAIESLRLQYPTPSGPTVLTISAGIALLGRGAALRRQDEVCQGGRRRALPRQGSRPQPSRGHPARVLRVQVDVRRQVFQATVDQERDDGGIRPQRLGHSHEPIGYAVGEPMVIPTAGGRQGKNDAAARVCPNGS